MYNIDNRRDFLRKLASKASQRTVELLKELSNLSSYIEFGTAEDIEKTCANIRRGFDMVRYSLEFDMEEEMGDNADNKNVLNASFFYDEAGNTFIMNIPGRLPKRAKINGKELVYDYDVSSYKQNMIRTFNSYFDSHSIKYDEKVNVIIVSHYNDISHMLDHDNTDPKPLIDGIKTNMLIDDNPLYMRLVFDAVLEKDKEEYTEVVVCPSN